MLTNQQFDVADQALRNTRVGLTTTHDRLKSLRETVLPQMEKNLTRMEKGFHEALRKSDFPIPKVTPDIPMGLLAGMGAFFLIGTTVGLMVYVRSNEDDEPQRARRKRRRKRKSSRVPK